METKLRVTLLQHTNEPEKLIASSAKLCYSPHGIKDIMEDLDEDNVRRFVNLLADMGHESPMEHLVFTFGIEGVSRSLLAQITRHRIASYSVKSQRYVKEGQFEYVVPPEIKADEEVKNKYIEAMENSQKAYNEISAILTKKHYDLYIKQGKPEKIAKREGEKKAIEDARYVLPNSCETKIIMTMNARSLINFFNKRCCRRAQWEIQILAHEMLKLVREKAPSLFKMAGPGCYSWGACPEGAMTCGDAKEVREFFKNLIK